MRDVPDKFKRGGGAESNRGVTDADQMVSIRSMVNGIRVCYSRSSLHLLLNGCRELLTTDTKTLGLKPPHTGVVSILVGGSLYPCYK